MNDTKKETPAETAADAASSAPRDRRATHRAAIDIPAVLHLGEEEFPCTILDLSVQGMAVSHKGGVPADAAVRLVFRLPNARQPLEVAGIVLRREPGTRSATLGIRLILPSEQVTAAIETWVSRNRSDRPFSRPGGGGATAGADPTERDGDLAALYRSAVDGSAKKDGRRGGLFGRWRRKTRS